MNCFINNSIPGKSKNIGVPMDQWEKVKNQEVGKLVFLDHLIEHFFIGFEAEGNKIHNIYLTENDNLSYTVCSMGKAVGKLSLTLDTSIQWRKPS